MSGSENAEPCRDDRGGAARRWAGEPEHPRREQHREEEQEVAVRQREHQPRGAERDEPESRASLEVQMRRDEHERHPERPQHLDVGKLCDAVRAEAHDQPGQHGGSVPPDDREGEAVCGERRQRIRDEQHEVVGGHRVGAHPQERRADEREAEQMLRKRQGACDRPEARRVPPSLGQRHSVSVPPENPRVERGIERVVRESGRQIPRDRPCEHDRQRGVTCARHRPRYETSSIHSSACHAAARRRGGAGHAVARRAEADSSYETVELRC